MVGYRERHISDKSIDHALNNPRIKELKGQLTNMAETLKRNAADEEAQQNGNDGMDEVEMRSSAQPRRPRGPLANQDNDRRVSAAQSRVDSIIKGLGLGAESDEDEPRIRQRRIDPTETVDPDALDDAAFLEDDAGEDSLPPPRPRTRGPLRASDRERLAESGVISNRDVSRSPRHRGQNRDTYEPQPDLSEVQELRLQLKQQAEDLEALKAGKRVPVEDPGPGKLRFARKPQAPLLEGMQKIDLLSQHLFYDFSPDDMLAKPIDVQTQLAISAAKAARDGDGDALAINDALQLSINPNIDLRALTKPDYFQLLYWLRFNSYTKIPFNITWTSSYGNKNLYSITQSNLRYLRADPDMDQLLAWQAMGLDYPRVRDMEILEFYDLEPEDREVYERAQYFQGKTPEEKVDRFYSATADTLAEIPLMMAACEHGIYDNVDLIDMHFDPARWRDTLREGVKTMHADAEKYKADGDIAMFTEIRAASEIYANQADAIEAKLEKGERVEPNAERVSLRFSPLAFFPVL